MGVRDCSLADLKCPTCGTLGLADIAEADDPLIYRPFHRIVRVSEGFEVTNDGAMSLDAEIACVKCGTRVY
jgi:hypothetical protein